jgi:hypothetical protein
MAENFSAVRGIDEGAVHKKRKHGFAHDCIRRGARKSRVSVLAKT